MRKPEMIYLYLNEYKLEYNFFSNSIFTASTAYLHVPIPLKFRKIRYLVNSETELRDSYVTTWTTRKKGPGPEMSFFKISIAKIVGPQQTSP